MTGIGGLYVSPREFEHTRRDIRGSAVASLPIHEGFVIVPLTLGAETRELVLQARQSLRPTGMDRQRVYALLQSRLDVGAGLAGAQPRAASNVSAAFSKTLAGGLLLIALGVPLVHVVRRAPAVVLEPAEALPARMQLDVDLLPPIAAAVTAVVSTETSEPTGTRRPGLARSDVPLSSDRLARESALLMRAESEYHAGRLQEALTFVDAHARAFPQGVLKQERLQLRAKLRCQLRETGDVDPVQGTRHVEQDVRPCQTPE